jgi:hypothetical protein
VIFKFDWVLLVTLDEFIKRVLDEAGIKIKVISGDEEADLISLGVKQAMKITETSMIMDIGGGSVECIICNDEKIFWKQSFEIEYYKGVSDGLYYDFLIDTLYRYNNYINNNNNTNRNGYNNNYYDDTNNNNNNYCGNNT